MMLVDVSVAHGFDPQIVAGQLEKHAGMTGITVFWDARIVRGDVGEAIVESLDEFPGVGQVTESDGEEIPGGIAPVIRASDVGLQIGDPGSLLTPEERLVLELDIAGQHAGRVSAWAKVARIRIF